MSNPLTIEAALQHWQPWLESFRVAQRDLEFQPDFTEKQIADWEKRVGWHKVWVRAREALDALLLPRTFALYWVACFCSGYDPAKPRTYYHIRLPNRAGRAPLTEGIAGSVVVLFEGSTAWHPTLQGSEVTMQLAKESDGERILPPFPMEFAVPPPIDFVIGFGAQKPYEVLPILPPPCTKVYVHWPVPQLVPPELSPYVTIRIPLFALGYSQSLFRQVNMQLRAISEWLVTTEAHPLHGMMRTGRPPSHQREWAIEHIDGAIDKAEMFNRVCEALLLVEKVRKREVRPAGHGRAVSYADFGKEASEKVMRARIRRRVQKWLEQSGIQLRPAAEREPRQHRT